MTPIDDVSISEMLIEQIQRLQRSDRVGIGRAQKRLTYTVRFTPDGMTMDTDVLEGIGIQLWTPGRGMTFGATDELHDVEATKSLLGRIERDSDLAPFHPAAVVPEFLLETACQTAPATLDSAALTTTVLSRLIAVGEELVHAALPNRIIGDMRVREESWQIFRSDGSNVGYQQNHAGVQLWLPGTSLGLRRVCPTAETLFHPERVKHLQDTLRSWTTAANDLAIAPRCEMYSGPVLVSAGIAKTMVHEAVGHALEADQWPTSVFATEGRLRVGEKIAASGVTITDGWLPHQFGWQPFSASGECRLPAKLIDHGILRSGLVDPYYGREAGAVSLGSDRVETYRSLPVPRMSHLALQVEPSIPLEGEGVEPAALYEVLRTHGLVNRKTSVMVLVGDGSSGQSDPATGKFSILCDRAYLVGPEGVHPYRGGVLMGSAEAFLPHIVAGFGPLISDFYSNCIKYGQSIPVGGSAHAFVFVEGSPGLSFYSL